MGPPIFIGGNVRVRNKPRHAAQSFNGATDFHRWKYERGQREPSDDMWLQWGHRFSSVEIAVGLGIVACLQKASMGPPIFIGGNGLKRRFVGFGDSASMGPPIFIGGNHRHCRVYADRRHASMGPPIFIGGNVPVFRKSTVHGIASMGPPIFIGGNGDNSLSWAL